MRWKYFTPHTWDEPRTRWEDVLLLPDDPRYRGQALWVTVVALGDGRGRTALEREEYESIRERLGEEPFVWEGTDMYVRAHDFDKEELLRWVRVFLDANEIVATDFVEAPLEDFEGRHPHADFLAELVRGYAERDDVGADEVATRSEDAPEVAADDARTLRERRARSAARRIRLRRGAGSSSSMRPGRGGAAEDDPPV